MNLADHLRSRHLDVGLHNPVLDESEGVVTFFLWNLMGMLVGFVQYRPDGPKKPSNLGRLGKYFLYKLEGTVAVWGVESLHLTPNVVFVTEGIFDAARLTERGYSAVAVLSNDPGSSVKGWLSALGRKVVVVADNDKAGQKLLKYGDHAVVTEGTDLAASADSFVDKLIAHFG